MIRDSPEMLSGRDIVLSNVEITTDFSQHPMALNSEEARYRSSRLPKHLMSPPPLLPDMTSNLGSYIPLTPANSTITIQAPKSSLPLPLIACEGGREPKGVSQTLSNHSFAHQLSHKLSATFGNPTIVHRSTLRTRPSIVSMHRDGPTYATEYSLRNRQDSTPSSSINYKGGASVGGYSMYQISHESNVTSRNSTMQREVNYNHGETMKTSATSVKKISLAQIKEGPIYTPTVVTVEMTANAKIFFESHYDSLLAGKASPRSLRRRDLEKRFEVQAMPENQQRLEFLAWAFEESAHLRLIRTLKSRSCKSAHISGTAVAGYEVVKILGKGSFGVVRLVREKGHAPKASIQVLQEDHSHLKASADDIQRPELNYQKNSQIQALKRSSTDVYAMKVIRKSDMLRNCQEGHLRAERDFLVASEKSRWVVPLIASFQDTTNLYLVMDYMVGGDFLGLLFRRNILKERHARWYLAEMILCIEETHRRNWIHRDIKPDNFLISASGHLKISDFGLAFDGHWSHDQGFYKSHRNSLMEKLGIKIRGDFEDQEEDAKQTSRTDLANILSGHPRTSKDHAQMDGPCEDETILQWRNRKGKRRMAASVVGTSQYMAPEVIRGDLYDGRCDWWSIGIILYEVGMDAV